MLIICECVRYENVCENKQSEWEERLRFFLSDALSHEQLKKWPREDCNRKRIVTHLFPGLRIRQAQWPTAFCSSSRKSASSASSTFSFQLLIKKVIKTSDHHGINKKAISSLHHSFLFTVYVDFLSAVWQFCTK